MVSRDKIRNELNKLNIAETDYGKNYWYFYAAMINGMPVAKPGISTVNILDRIDTYLNKEHSNQKKYVFKMIAVIEFPRKRSLAAAEKFIKENNDARFNIFNDQPAQLEQYQLKPFYEEVKEYLNNFPFSSRSYINKSASKIIDDFIWAQTTKYLSTNYEKKESKKEYKKEETRFKKTDVPAKPSTSSSGDYVWVNGHYRSGTYVNGYYRSNGTYVNGHYRSGSYVNGYWRRK